MGIYGICGKYDHQDGADGDDPSFVHFFKQVVDDRRKYIGDCQTADAKYQQSLRADSSVQIQIISAVVPPLCSAGGKLHDQ